MPFKKGQSGNPAGRPKGARQRLGDALYDVLLEDFLVHGKQAIEKLRADDNKGYIDRIIESQPTEQTVNVNSSQNSEPVSELQKLYSDFAGTGAAEKDKEPMPN